MQLALLAALVSGAQRGRRLLPANLPPTVNAGTDQSVTTGATVNLSASASDPDGTIAAYAWTQISGTAVTINNPTTATPNFTAPGSVATIVIRCTVTDNLGATAFDDLTVTVTSAAGGTNYAYSPYIQTYVGGSLQVTLGWDAPPSTVDGLPLTGGDAITGYEIYYAAGATAVNATVASGTLVTISNPADVSKIIGSLSAATQYWFAMRAITAYGPSDLSNAVTATTS